MKTRCLFDKMVPIQELKFHPKNRNNHPQYQIDRLAKILEYQGWRAPVKVSNQSGYVTAGHGRIAAAIHNNWTEVPVSFQDYDSTEEEIADLNADNAIALWAEIDLSGVNSDLMDLGPGFDVDMLGFDKFTLLPEDKPDPKQIQCPKCGENFTRARR